VLNDPEQRRSYDEQTWSGRSKAHPNLHAIRTFLGGQTFRDIIGDVGTLPLSNCYSRCLTAEIVRSFCGSATAALVQPSVWGWICSPLMGAIGIKLCDWVFALAGRGITSAGDDETLPVLMGKLFCQQVGRLLGRKLAGPLGGLLGEEAFGWGYHRARPAWLWPRAGDDVRVEEGLARLLCRVLEQRSAGGPAAYVEQCRHDSRRLLAAGGPALVRAVGIAYQRSGRAQTAWNCEEGGLLQWATTVAEIWVAAAKEHVEARALILRALLGRLAASPRWEAVAAEAMRREVLHEAGGRVLRVCGLALGSVGGGRGELRAAALAEALEQVAC
jgi:hypothetical protein